ncbi:MAG: PH domain-containing protein [Anaerolineales bacterium]|jgi:hypothetical protein
MDFIPSRKLGLILGGLALLLLLSASAVGVIRLASAEITPFITLWVCLPLICIPLAALIVYHLYGLATARYRLDRDGFYLTWGFSGDQIPLAAIKGIRPASEVPGRLVPFQGRIWPGLTVGRHQVEDLGEVEFFATTDASGMVLLAAGDRHIAISPPDPEAFRQAFIQAARMGSLERIEERSRRPNFMLTRMWADLLARYLILGGLVVPLTLLAYLAARAPGLPATVPFGFDATGAPNPFTPPGRLLLLPLIGGFCWVADVALGTWLYRRKKDRVLAYGLWGGGLLVGLLFWAAAIHLLTAL